MLEAIERSAPLRRGRPASPACTASTPEDAARFSGQGFGLITAGGDLTYLRDALAAGARHGPRSLDAALQVDHLGLDRRRAEVARHRDTR